MPYRHDTGHLSKQQQHIINKRDENERIKKEEYEKQKSKEQSHKKDS